MQEEVIPHVQQALEALAVKVQQERLKVNECAACASASIRAAVP